MLNKIRVLQTVVQPSNNNNPFVSLLVRNLPPDIETSWFSWGKFLSANYDVLHIQWPEKLVTAGSTSKAMVKRVAFAVGLRRARRRGIPIILTVHNLTAHERPAKAEQRAIQSLYEHVTTFVALNDSADLGQISPEPPVIIPHGSYAQLYSTRSPESIVPGQFVFVGSIREYKNVPTLIRAFRGVAALDPSMTLHIGGRAWSEALATQIEQSADRCDQIRLTLRELDDSELISILSAAEVAVLPYTQLYNSGVVFLALTIGVPLLLPRTPATTQLQAEFSEAWIQLFDAPLTPDALIAAHSALTCANDRALPDLAGRDWSALSAAYAKTYRDARSRQGVHGHR